MHEHAHQVISFMNLLNIEVPLQTHSRVPKKYSTATNILLNMILLHEEALKNLKRSVMHIYLF